jgi:hypothetical protein
MRRARAKDYSSVRWLVTGRHQQSLSQNKKNKSKKGKAMK